LSTSRKTRWQLAILTLLTLCLYAPTLAHLVAQWTDPYFGHGFFVPVFSAFVIWQDRARLRRIASAPSWFGALILAFALCLLILGEMGVELFTARVSLLIAVAGLIPLFRGWSCFRALLFPWAFLFLMVPIPAILFNQITFPLQFLASRLAAATLSLLSVPVLLQGNVIELAHTRLEVAEACSGIRSLLSLTTLAIIYGYLIERRIGVRIVLALAAIPIAVVANSIRIIGTGLLVHYLDSDAAEGPLHAWWGVIIFVISLAMLYALHAAIRFVWPDQPQSDNNSEPIPDPRQSSSTAAQFVLATTLILATALFLRARTHNEVFPPRAQLNTFPAQLAGFTGFDRAIPQDELTILGPGDFLLRDYDSPRQPPVNLFIAYFPSQRTGETPHSPQHCLPGAGWAPIENKRIQLALPGHAPFPANRYVIAMGDARQLVLYWFWAHDRGVASEYWNKYYLVKDSIQLHRSDGSLIRLITPMSPGETPEQAQSRLEPFASSLLPQLNTYIPR